MQEASNVHEENGAAAVLEQIKQRKIAEMNILHKSRRAMIYASIALIVAGYALATVEPVTGSMMAVVGKTIWGKSVSVATGGLINAASLGLVGAGAGLDGAGIVAGVFYRRKNKELRQMASQQNNNSSAGS